MNNEEFFAKLEREMNADADASAKAPKQLPEMLPSGRLEGHDNPVTMHINVAVTTSNESDGTYVHRAIVSDGKGKQEAYVLNCELFCSLMDGLIGFVTAMDMNKLLEKNIEEEGDKE